MHPYDIDRREMLKSVSAATVAAGLPQPVKIEAIERDPPPQMIVIYMPPSDSPPQEINISPELLGVQCPVVIMPHQSTLLAIQAGPSRSPGSDDEDDPRKVFRPDID